MEEEPARHQTTSSEQAEKKTVGQTGGKQEVISEERATPAVREQPWGPPLLGLHCRLELEKEVFSVSETINIWFRIEPVDGQLKEVSDLVPVRKEGLIENLDIVGPDSKKLPLKTVPKYPPHGRFATRFPISDYYDFTKLGEYSITAKYPLKENETTVLNSQTIALLVVPDDFIIISVEADVRKYDTTGPVPLKIQLSTGSDGGVVVQSLSVRFQMDAREEIALICGGIYSYPSRDNSFPSRLTLTGEAMSCEFDLASMGWDMGISSLDLRRPLSSFIKPGEKQYIVAVITGLYGGRTFEVKSQPVAVEFSKDNRQ